MKSIKRFFNDFSFRSVKRFIGKLLIFLLFVGIFGGLGYIVYEAEIKSTTKKDVDKNIKVGKVENIKHVKDRSVFKTEKEEETTVIRFESGWEANSNRFDGGEGFFTVDKSKFWYIREYYHNSDYYLCPEEEYRQEHCYIITSINKK